jgi:hypothetical protein
MDERAAVSASGYRSGLELYGSRYNGENPATRCLFCIVWVGVVYRGRTVPVVWQVVAQSSSMIRLWTVQRVLRHARGTSGDSGKLRQVDAHWKRGMSYLKIGWNWIRLAMTQRLKITVHRFLSGEAHPEPAVASKRKRDDALKREFTVLSRFPAS